jgi:hypothetical protein
MWGGVDEIGGLARSGLSLLIPSWRFLSDWPWFYGRLVNGVTGNVRKRKQNAKVMA